MGETEPGLLPPASAQTEVFLCECGRPDCMEYMEIDLETVRSFVKNGWPMIVPEHRLSREAEARARAEELREHARALRAQAHLQVTRAHRNTDRRTDT